MTEEGVVERLGFFFAFVVFTFIILVQSIKKFAKNSLVHVGSMSRVGVRPYPTCVRLADAHPLQRVRHVSDLPIRILCSMSVLLRIYTIMSYGFEYQFVKLSKVRDITCLPS